MSNLIHVPISRTRAAPFAKVAAATTLATNHYLAYDVSIAANDSAALTLGITLAATNAIRTYASNANLTFTAFGSEN